MAELESKLLAAARAHPPSDCVPYAFEQRIMARLAAIPAPDYWAAWAGVLWRAAAPCVAVMLLMSAWSLATSASGNGTDLLGAELENTVYAAVENPAETW